MAFKIINLRTQQAWPKSDSSLDPMIFETGEEANRAASNLNAGNGRYATYTNQSIHGIWTFEFNNNTLNNLQDNGRVHSSDKWQVRSATSDKDWREREKNRFASGEYQAVPWADHAAWLDILKNNKNLADHFVHVSKDKNDLLAYTPDEKAGVADNQRRKTPQRYLSQYVPSQYSGHVNEFLNLWTKHVNANLLRFATTRDDARRVYEIGSDSCMKGKSTRWFPDDNAAHPGEAYIAGDLAIAYIERAGTVTARCVCWPDRKLMSDRVYGNESGVLQSLLSADGYKKGEFLGARLLKIPYQNKFITPYIDPPTSPKVIDDGEFFVIAKTHSEKTIHELQSPLTELQVPYISQLSGKEFNPRKDRQTTVYVSENETQTWSRSEAKEHAFTCSKDGYYYCKKNVEFIAFLSDGGELAFVAKHNKKRNEFVECEFYKMKTDKAYSRIVVVGYEKDGSPIFERWSYHAINTHAIELRYEYLWDKHGNEARHYASWLTSRLPLVDSQTAAHEEHLHSAAYTLFGSKRPTYPERVTVENAHRLLRRVKLNSKGEYEPVV